MVQHSGPLATDCTDCHGKGSKPQWKSVKSVAENWSCPAVGLPDGTALGTIGHGLHRSSRKRFETSVEIREIGGRELGLSGSWTAGRYSTRDHWPRIAQIVTEKVRNLSGNP